MNDFYVGEYVIYKNGKKIELGRVVKVAPQNCYVCYSTGCTAACTPKEKLHHLLNKYTIVQTTLGYNRFNGTCDDYDPDVCINCEARPTGTCSPVPDYEHVFECDVCGAMDTDGVPNFCPNCGRKVVA